MTIIYIQRTIKVRIVQRAERNYMEQDNKRARVNRVWEWKCEPSNSSVLCFFSFATLSFFISPLFVNLFIFVFFSFNLCFLSWIHKNTWFLWRGFYFVLSLFASLFTVRPTCSPNLFAKLVRLFIGCCIYRESKGTVMKVRLKIFHQKFNLTSMNLFNCIFSKNEKKLTI